MVIDGVNFLIAMEKKLEAGEKIDGEVDRLQQKVREFLLNHIINFLVIFLHQINDSYDVNNAAWPNVLYKAIIIFYKNLYIYC